MTRFADQLFDDLMREHGSTLAHTTVPAAPKRHPAVRPVLLTAGAGGLAVAATVGALVATGGGTPTYAVTAHTDGTVTLAVYQESGIAAANAQLHRLGDDRVVVVPIGSDCPSINSLPAPAVQAKQVNVQAGSSGDGSVTVDAHGIPAGDILVLGWTSAGRGQFSMSGSMTATSGHMSASGKESVGGKGSASSHGTGSGQWSAGSAARLTSGPAPSCVSVPPPPAGGHSTGGSSGSNSAPNTQQKLSGKSAGSTANSGAGQSTNRSS